MTEAVFDFIYGEALDDATRRTGQEGLKSRLLNCNALKDIVKEYANAVINGEAPKCSKYMEEMENLGIEGFFFGNIQKLVNMTMKYLYVGCFCDDTVRSRFDACDCPMDSIMLDFVFESYYIVVLKKERKRGERPGFRKDLTWSRLKDKEDKEQYTKYQETIRKIIENRKLNINPIEFDYMFWDEAKRIYDLKATDKKDALKKLWE